MSTEMDDIELEEQTPVVINSIPLFIKKLWKMVNDKDAENIISWNETGDSFVIHDQLQFITKLLPHYFKHNNMASFIRQLNFYNFHKVPNAKDEIQFSHTCFMKDVPEILPFIRRKTPVLKPKAPENYNGQEIQNLLSDIKNLKGKHSLVDKELALLKQENAALWSELNSLRSKYTKQSTIINMLIHFLITYIHSHQSAFSKSNIEVATGDTKRNNIKVGPPLLKIGYQNNKSSSNKNEESYTVIEPGTSSSITTYSVNLPKHGTESQRPRKNIHSVEEMLAMVDQTYPKLKKQKKVPVTYSIKLPGNQTQKLNRPAIQSSLLELLKENERLCEEETDEMLEELDAENEIVTDINEQDTIMEDITNDTLEDSTIYTISYPDEPVIQNPDCPEYVQPSDLMEINVNPIENEGNILTNQTADLNPVTQNNLMGINMNTIENEGDILTNQTADLNPITQNNLVTKEIPLKTKSGVLKYTITHPNIINTINKDSNSENVKVLNPTTGIKNVVRSKTNIKPKFVKIPTKNLKPFTNKSIKTNLNKTSTTNNFNQNISKSANPQALLEILKENEKLTKDNLKEQNINLPSSSNMDNFLSNPLTDFYSFDLANDVSAEENSNRKSQGKSISKGKQFDIRENPKKNLGMYVDNTQEEIDILQDILNDLTSTDLTDILNNPTTNVDLETESATTDEPMGEYINLNELKNNFFD